MPVIPEARRYSVPEIPEFPADGSRYELVAGELLVTPSPAWRHQVLVSRLMARLLSFDTGFDRVIGIERLHQ